MSPLSLLPLLIISVGGYLLIKLRFFYVMHPIRTLKFTFRGQNVKESIISLMLALAGTLGVGNIVGVAYGIYVGGAGSVFWLSVSALFSSAIKYSEVFLSSKHNTGYGIISVIDKNIKPTALSKAYAALALILSFSMGSIMQAQAICDSASAFGRSSAVIVSAVFVFVALVCLLGKSRIKKAVAFVIPAATLLYTGMCLSVIFHEAENLLTVALEILSSAFDFSALRGGIGAFILSSGIKEGFARGLLSNEAGAGTSSFSHTSHAPEAVNTHDASYPMRAGIYGILEVIFDTLVLCPLTAFVILLSRREGVFHGSIFEISEIFTSYIGNFAPFLLLITVSAFAVSTTLCWYYYGRVALDYLTHGRHPSLFSALFIISFAVGLLFKIDILIHINDIILFLLTLITLYTLIKNRASLAKPE